MPATPDPRPKVSASIQGVRMPIAAAICRFCVTARIASPSEVKRNAAISAATTRNANTMM